MPSAVHQGLGAGARQGQQSERTHAGYAPYFQPDSRETMQANPKQSTCSLSVGYRSFWAYFAGNCTEPPCERSRIERRRQMRGRSQRRPQKASCTSALLLETYCVRHSGKNRLTACEQHDSLQHRSEKHQHQCHGQQHIDARGGEQTCDNVALKDSLDVYGVHNTFPRGLKRRVYSILATATGARPPSWQPPHSALGNCGANRAASTPGHKLKANWRMNRHWKKPGWAVILTPHERERNLAG